MKNLIIVVDAWEEWPIEDTRVWPHVSKEARAFGFYINTMLNHIRKDPNNTIVHYTWNKDIDLMNSIDRTGEKIYYSRHEIELDHTYPEYTKMYVCGFHYGICIDSTLSWFQRHSSHWRYENIGLIENMSLRHPMESTLKIDLRRSFFKHFYYSIPDGFILLDK